MPDGAPKVKIVTLGCAKNEVDSEEIAGVLQQAGYAVDGAAKRTDVTVINTCGFLESAKEESVRAIKDAIREKRAGKTGKVIVAGCLAQRLGAELERLAPGADAYVGVGQMGRFDQIVSRFAHLPTLTPQPPLPSGKDEFASAAAPTPTLTPQPPLPSGKGEGEHAPQHLWADVETRARTGKPWSAYLKVSEGCDHPCTFCTIPSFRGKHASKPIERVLAEARHLAKTGCREINLIAQDVTQYGYDLYGKFTLPRLLRELNDVEGIEWIRILYFYPSRLTDEVIEALATLPKVAKYIDIPLQHSQPDVLRRMKRPMDGDRYLKLVEKVRASVPDVAIRSTFIVGFPGETDAEFGHLIEFVQAARLDRVGAFRFSREAGTPSFEMDGQVSAKVKNERYDRIMRTQQRISLEVNRSWVGRSLRVLVDEQMTESGVTWSIGRSHRDAPEIDGLVFARGSAEPGSFVDVEIDGAEAYDLYGALQGHASEGQRRMTALRMAQPKAPR